MSSSSTVEKNYRYHSYKCGDIELDELKNKVIELINDSGIDASKLEIRAFNCYGGDVRVYLDVIERVSSKTSFRKESADIKDGKVVGYFGTKGKHVIKERNYVAFNTEDFIDDSASMLEYNLQLIKKYLNDNN